MTKSKNTLFFILAALLYAVLYFMAYKITLLEHRVSVLEDQMATTMNLLTDDGHKVIE